MTTTRCTKTAGCACSPRPSHTPRTSQLAELHVAIDLDNTLDADLPRALFVYACSWSHLCLAREVAVLFVQTEFVLEATIGFGATSLRELERELGPAARAELHESGVLARQSVGGLSRN